MRSESEMQAEDVPQAHVEISHSPELDQFATALALAQGQMEAAKKDSTNPHFRSKYADLASVREACRPLSANGIAVVQLPANAPDGAAVVTMLIHKSGQFMRARCWLPVGQATAQAYGSAMTYARRYGLSCLAGVVADEDDDGTAATLPALAQAAPEPTPDAGVEGANKRLMAAGKGQAKDRPVRALPAPTLDPGPSGRIPATRVRYGDSKGKYLCDLDATDLDWQLSAAIKNVAKQDAKWHQANEQWLASIQDEIARRE